MPSIPNPTLPSGWCAISGPPPPSGLSAAAPRWQVVVRPRSRRLGRVRHSRPRALPGRRHRTRSGVSRRGRSAPRPRPCLPLVPPPRPRSGTPRSAGRHCRPVTPRYRTRPTRSRPDRATDPPGTTAVGPPGPTSFSRRKQRFRHLFSARLSARHQPPLSSRSDPRPPHGQALQAESRPVPARLLRSACLDRLRLLSRAAPRRPSATYRRAPLRSRSRPLAAAPLRRRRPASLAARRQR